MTAYSLDDNLDCLGVLTYLTATAPVSLYVGQPKLGLLPWEAPIVIAEQHKLFFSFL